jgi:hypothetical protein
MSVLRREGEDYDTFYYDATTEASPRSKPAEQVIRLWNGILSPSQ